MVPKKRNPQLNHGFRGLLFPEPRKDGRASGTPFPVMTGAWGAGLEERCVLGIPPKRCIEVVSPKWMGLNFSIKN